MASSVLKGIAVAICNVLVVAVGLSVTQRSMAGGSDMFCVVCVLGGIPGVVAGAVIGFVAGRLPVLRRLALVSLAVFAVVVLGILIEPTLIAFASAPTIVAALALEGWTRVNLKVQPPAAALSCISKGALLGVANVAVTAVIVGMMVWLDPPVRGWSGDAETLGFGYAAYVKGAAIGTQVTLLVAFAGLLPGLVAGAAIGRLTRPLRAWSPHARFAFLGALATAVVVALGLATQEVPFILPACIPAALASFGLERWTREPPALPRAIARS
jgi:hypothetical protein